jgi:hypothetical protein
MLLTILAESTEIKVPLPFSGKEIISPSLSLSAALVYKLKWFEL